MRIKFTVNTTVIAQRGNIFLFGHVPGFAESAYARSRIAKSVHFVSALTEHCASQLTTLSRLKSKTTQHILMTGGKNIQFIVNTL
jgi:hypothetical protein